MFYRIYQFDLNIDFFYFHRLNYRNKWHIINSNEFKKPPKSNIKCPLYKDASNNDYINRI